MMEKFIQTQQETNVVTERRMNDQDKRMSGMENKIDQILAHQKILENQVAQQASSSQTKAYGKFPSQGEKPHIEHCKAISLRSGREVESPMPKATKKEVVNDEIEEKSVDGEEDPNQVQNSNETPSLKTKEGCKSTRTKGSSRCKPLDPSFSIKIY